VVSVGDDCDVDCYILFEELHVLSSVIHFHISDRRDMLKFIVQRKPSEVYPNVFILLRIIPVTTAVAERSFSRLTLIKTYLRTTMIDGIGHSWTIQESWVYSVPEKAGKVIFRVSENFIYT
jgi:hypothetical protein